MRVQVHTKFCLLCVLTFLFHQCTHCHEGHAHQHGVHHHANHRNTHGDLPPSNARVTVSPTSRRGVGDMLEQEQRFYIQELFRRYGQKDRLDFHGFQSLLFSLGLGEVKVVNVDHETLGHDHVAHLDALDMQEGLHSHDGHGHDHGHGHHSTGSHGPHTERQPTTCSQTTAAVTAASHARRKQEHHQGHAHDHRHHQHSEGHEHSADHVSDEHAGQSGSENPGVQVTREDDDAHTDKQEGGGGSEAPPVVQLPSSHLEAPPTSFPPSPAPTTSVTKKPRKASREKGLRARNKASLPAATPSLGDHKHSHDHEHKHGHGHSHKHKREAPQAWPTPTLPGHQLSHQHEECLNLTQLLTYYGLSPDSLISPTQFTYLCPALLYQIDSRVCIRHYQVDVEQEVLETVSSVWVWLWSFVSITIISLLSLLGVVLVPILNQACFKFLLTFLVALAVGTLSGDALLHLLPHSQGHHDHSEGGSGPSEDLLTTFDGVWKGLTALAGIYLLFIIEHCIGMFKHYKDHTAMKRRSDDGTVGRKLSDHKLNRHSDAEWLHLKPLSEDPDSTTVSCDNGHNDTQFTELQTPDSPTNRTPLTPPNPQPEQTANTNARKAKKHGHARGHGHSHGGNCLSDQEMKEAGIASIAWMVIMGDGMHNFSDGLAIGAAFSANLTGGISTSVAVFCHELPHELGDFAVLLKAGMSVKQAMVYNLLSALMAYVGMIVGTAVGQYTDSFTSWIFAITAGMFLYVALVDMLPEMLHGEGEEPRPCGFKHFLLQNLGMLSGFTIMLLIAIYEDRIVFNF